MLPAPVRDGRGRTGVEDSPDAYFHAGKCKFGPILGEFSDADD